jgi:hypothetical protein
MNDRYVVRPLGQILRQNLQLDTDEKEEDHFDYFTFDTEIPTQLKERWEIVGINQHAYPERLDLRILHVDDEMFDFKEHFSALRDAPNHLTMVPKEYRALIDYLTAHYPEIQGERKKQSHFHFLQPGDLVAMHVPPRLLGPSENIVYRYIPSSERTESEKIYLMRFSSWVSQYGSNQATTLDFSAFDPSRLEEASFTSFPLFGPVQGVSTFSFDLASLSEFVELLNDFSYEEFRKKHKI